jgi:hypothetical protein
MPQISPLSPKVIGTLGRKPKPGIELPKMSVELANVGFDSDKLRAYREICGFEGGAVPLPYPQVNAITLQMHLLTQPQFPLPLVGLVHLKNTIEQKRELHEDETFHTRVALVAQKTTDKGLEFELETTCTDKGGAVAWRAVATVLNRAKAAPKRKGPPPPPPPAQLGQYHLIDAPEDIGRRYGRISGDMNPIHLYPLTAKFLGFDRHIAHGMWTMARCCALLQKELGGSPRRLDTQFRQPLFLPTRAALRYGASGNGVGFSLFGVRSGKLHLEGLLA